MTSNEWEFFMGCGDDIGVDRGGEVRGLLIGLVREFEAEMKGRRERLETAMGEVEGEEKAVLGSLVERWKQIEAGLKEYVNTG